MSIFLYDKYVPSLQRVLLEVDECQVSFPAFSIPTFTAYFLPVITRSNLLFIYYFIHFPEPQIIFFPATGVN